MIALALVLVLLGAFAFAAFVLWLNRLHPAPVPLDGAEAAIQAELSRHAGLWMEHEKRLTEIADRLNGLQLAAGLRRTGVRPD